MDTYRSTIAWNKRVFISFEEGYVEIGLPAPLAKNLPGLVRYLENLMNAKEYLNLLLKK